MGNYNDTIANNMYKEIYKNNTTYTREVLLEGSFYQKRLIKNKCEKMVKNKSCKTCPDDIDSK